MFAKPKVKRCERHLWQLPCPRDNRLFCMRCGHVSMYRDLTDLKRGAILRAMKEHQPALWESWRAAFLSSLHQWLLTHEEAA